MSKSVLFGLLSLIAIPSCKGTSESHPPKDSIQVAGPATQDQLAVEPELVTPDIVTEASTRAESEAALEKSVPIVLSDAVDGNALRKAIRKRLHGDLSPVTVLQGTNARQLGQAICEASVPQIDITLPILLKPNIGGFAGLKSRKRNHGDNGMQGRTTDPEFVRGVIHCLQSRGHKTITVADSKATDAVGWARLVKASGYQAMAKEEGVALVALSDDGVFDVEGTQPGKPLAITGMENTSVPTLVMPKLLAEHLHHGLVISLPKIKAHRFSVVSLGIKGLQGTVMYSDKTPAYRQKWRSHRELGAYTKRLKAGADDRKAYIRALEIFSERMTDVLEVEAPHVVLAEGAPAMSGDGFHQLFPIPQMVAIGGTNTISVDAIGARFLGLFDNQELAAELGGHTTSPLIEAAAERFAVDLSTIETNGNGASLLDEKRPIHFIAFAPFEIISASKPPFPDTSPIIPENNSTPTVYATHLNTGSIELDGKANEGIWKRAKPIYWDTDYRGASTGITTQVRFVWSTSALYVLFELEEAGLAVDTARPIEVERDGLYKEDCVELFIAPDHKTPDRYYEIEVGPFGHWLDIAVDLSAKKGRFNQRWTSGVRIGTTRDLGSRRATIEMAITSPEILKVLQAGARLPLGLFRMEGRSPNRKYLAWSPARTPKPKFHVPTAFGMLELEQ